MNNQDLVDYICSLTPEQIDKLISQLTRLTSLLSGQAQPCPPEQTKQSQ